MSVEFEDLYLRTTKRSWFRTVTGRCIVKGVSGRFKAGELSAILGPSGAGKTSLLNVLSGFESDGVAGSLLVNGKPRNEKQFRKLSCYITQEDHFQPMLTLKETMYFAALLKLPSNTPREERDIVVDNILNTLGLYGCKATQVELLSGGQRKRLSIAQELIDNPQTLFLDEPTSGLDNVTTANLLRLLRILAQKGRTIICTIHQPSASLLQLFDNVYVLANGLCVYQGATDQLVPFLSSAGFNCPRHYNPADFVIEMTDGDESNENINRLSKAICNGKKSHCKRIDQTITIQEGSLPSSEDKSRLLDTNCNLNKISPNHHEAVNIIDPLSNLKVKYKDYEATFWVQFWSLFQRMILQIWRNKLGLKIQFFHHFVCGVAVGCVFYDQANNGNEFFTHMKYCIGIIFFFAYTQTMIPILTFPFEVKLVIKEHFNQWYGLKPYFFALMCSKLPTLITFSMLYITLVYFMIGLPIEIYRFVVFSIVGVMTALIAEGLGFAIGATFNVTNGSAIGPLTLAPLLGFAIYGFDFAKQIPPFMVPLMRSSFLRCGVVATVISIFGMERGTLHCAKEHIFCPFRDPKIVIHYLDLKGVSPWQEIFNMFIMLLLFRFLCYYGLKQRIRT